MSTSGAFQVLVWVVVTDRCKKSWNWTFVIWYFKVSFTLKKICSYPGLLCLSSHTNRSSSTGIATYKSIRTGLRAHLHPRRMWGSSSGSTITSETWAGMKHLHEAQAGLMLWETGALWSKRAHRPGWVLTSGIHRAQLTWAHLVPVLVVFMAPPLFGHNRHCGWMPRTQERHSQLPSGTLRMP